MSFFKKFWNWFSAPAPKQEPEHYVAPTFDAVVPTVAEPVVPTVAEPIATSIMDVPADTFTAEVAIESVAVAEYVEKEVQKSTRTKKPAAITAQKKLPVQKKPAPKKSPSKKKTSKK